MAKPVVETTAQTSLASPGTSSDSINLPSGIAAGDLLVMAVMATQNIASVTATGWLPLPPVDAHNPADIFLLWREADGGEGATETVSWNSNPGEISAAVWRISGADTSAPFAGLRAKYAGTSSTALPTMKVPESDLLVLATASVANPTTVSSWPTGWTENEAVAYPSGANERLYVAERDNAPTDDTNLSGESVSFSSADDHNLVQLLVRPDGTNTPGIKTYTSASDNASATSIDVDFTDLTASGDVLVTVIAAETGDATTPTMNTPTGWTEELTHTRGDIALFVFSRDADGTETTVTFDGDTYSGLMAVGFVLGNARTGGVFGATATNDGTGNPSGSPGITTTQDASLLLTGHVLDDTFHSQGSVVATYWWARHASPVDGDAETQAIGSSLMVGADSRTTAGATGTYNHSVTGVSGDWLGYTFELLGPNQAPTTPTLVSPSDGATVDLSGAPTFDWTFNDPDGGDTQSAYYLRRKVSGGSYEYWNASTSSWQSTEVKNADTATAVTFSSGDWSNGTTYNWSVATEDAEGAKSPYATDATVTGSSPPSVTATGPAGSVSDTTSPTVAWSYSDPEGDAQVTYRVKVFDQATYEAGGFDPDASTTVWDSGQVTSSTKSRAIGTELENGTTYRAYVQVTQSGGLASGWSFTGFTIALDPPASPTVTVTADDTNARVQVDVQAHDNLLDANQADLETDTAGWEVVLNASIAHTTAQASNGSGSLEVTTTDAGYAAVRTTTGLSGAPVVEGESYDFRAKVRVPAAQNVRVKARWFDDAGSFISDDNGTFVSSAADTWVEHTLVATAPVDAAFASIFVELQSSAASEVWHVDQAQIAPGSPGAWHRGGLADVHTAKVERSTDGGTTWETVRGASAVAYSDSQVTVYDYEAPIGATVQYRAKTTAEV